AGLDPRHPGRSSQCARVFRGGVRPVTRVLLLGIDGCPIHLFSRDVMPRIWALSDAGGRSADGRAPLPSSTYPCFSSILTGCHPARHGVRTTASRPGAVPGWAGQPRVVVPTLFDVCHAGADTLVGAVLDAAAPSWTETVVIIVSDHGMEPRTDHPPIDLMAYPGVSEVATDMLVDGGAALIRLRDGTAPTRAGTALGAVPGVGGWSSAGHGV